MESIDSRDAIAVVRNLLHREGTQHSCKCLECRSIKHVCGLALEAVQMKESRKKIAGDWLE